MHDGDKKKLLFYSEAWGGGGIEAFVMNVLPSLVGSGWDIDIFSTWDWPGLDDSELDALGVRRFAVFRGHRPNQLKRLAEGPRAFRRLLDENGYDAVWVNTMNGTGLRYVREAELAGVPVRVAHSHNADVGDGAKALKRVVSGLGSLLWGGSATARVACSRAAGRHLFGGRPFDVVPNGVDVERFRFSEDKRRTARAELGVGEGETLVGSIGRIAPQKNPLFQVRVFAEYLKLDPRARYLFLGKPDMVDEVMKLAGELGISDRVIIHGPVDDPSPYYSALDAFLMPSFYEGLGFVKVEAQCASLPVLATDALPAEADVTELVRYRLLDDAPAAWAEFLFDLVREYRVRRCEPFADEVARAGFSVEACSEKVLAVLEEGPEEGSR